LKWCDFDFDKLSLLVASLDFHAMKID
jgi:hypothetical protein